MVIDRYGKVGIGTQIPQEELTIMSATPALMLRDSDQLGSYTQVSNANQDMYFSANGASSHANFIFRSGNNGSFEERFRIHSSGVVMINTTNSSSRTLNLKGTFGILSASQTGVLDMSVTDGGEASIGPYVAGGSSLIFKTNSSGAGVAERLRIISTGEVSIGGFTPTASAGILQIAGGLRVAGSASASDTITPYIYRTSGVDNLNFATSGVERVQINSTGTTIFKGHSTGTEQVKIQSNGGGTGLFIGNFQGIDAGDASSRLGVGKNDNALIFTNASGSQISNFAIGNTDSIPLILSTANTRRIHIRGDGRIIMGTGIPTYTNSIVHVEGSGINVEAEYTLEDGTGASPQFSIFGSNSHVRIDMGTLDVGPYAGYIQARYDNDPEQSGTSNSGLEPLILNPRGGALSYNCHDSDAIGDMGGSATYGGVVIRAGRAVNPTVNNASTAIKIFPGEVRAYSGTGAYGEQNQGTKYGGIAWNVLDPHNGAWGASYGGHHCWMGMSMHSVPGQEFSNWQVQMNDDSSGGSFATNVAIQASPQGYVTKPSQPSFYVRRSTGGDNRAAANPVTEWANPGTTQTSGNPVHNIGGHFSHSTGLFTAPINGVYHFDAAAGYKQNGYDFNQKLYINSVAQAEGVRFIDGGDDLVSHSLSTMSLTCYLHKGDTVGIELGYVHHVNTTFNYFSGYLVQ
jgi:hypothetical protein